MTVASGTAFPSSPNAAELFFRTDTDVTVRGMYLYVNGGWDRLASADALSAPTGSSLPSTALAGDLFYLNSNDTAESLYAYDGAAWNKVSNDKAVAVATANGFAGTVDNATAGTVTVTLTTTATGILKGNGTAISAAVAGDFPTLNQNTTGSAAALTTARTISTTGDSTWTTTFDGSANVTGTSTLATVNASPQTDALRKVTVNGKGLVTATSAVVVADLTSIIGINDLLPSQTAQANKFLKTDGTNTSWATPPDIPGGSTTQIQFNDGGVFAGNSNFTINKATGGVSFLVTPTINGTPVGTGNVSTVTVVSANGFAGSVATNTTTPAITISTSVVGLLKGNGTSISNAAVGTDYSNGTSALSTGILKSTTGTGVLTIAVAGDFPTLNQNTTGTATNATNVGVTDDTATNATVYPSWVTATTGNLPIKVSSTKTTLNPSTGLFTSSAFSTPGNLTFSGTGNRIIGDFSNGTMTNRVMFQTSTANSSTSMGVIPNGTGTVSSFNFFNASNPLNASFVQLGVNSTQVILGSGQNGTGTYLPVILQTGGANRLTADITGNIIIGAAALATTATDGFLHVTSTAGVPVGTPTAYSGRVPLIVDSTNNDLYFYNGGWKKSTINSTLRAAQGIPNNADSSTNGFAFGADGDTGMFGPGSGPTAGIVAMYSNNAETARFISTGISTGLNLTFTGASSRITGDFSNASLANRLLVQSSTANGSTSLGTIPAGTNTTSNMIVFNAADPTNASYAQLYVSASGAAVVSGRASGSGTYLPLSFQTGGTDRLAIDVAGNIAMGGTTTSDSSLTITQNANNYGVSVNAATSGVNSGKSLIRLLNSGYTVERLRLEGTSDTSSRIGFNTGLSVTNINGSTTHIAVDGTNSTVTMNGLLVLPALFAGIELGSTTAASTPYLDFHSSGNLLDYDARILSSGGNSTQGNSTLTFYAGGITLLNPTLTGVPINNISAQNTGQLAGLRNVIINGDFAIAQRGTTQTTVGYGSVDRFFFTWTSGTATIAQQTSSVAESATGVYKCLNISGTSLVGGYMDHGIESVTTLAGKTVTLSYFYTNNSGTDAGVAPSLIQTFGTGGSPSADVGISATSDITTTVFGLQQRQLTFTIPSVAAKTLGTSGTDRLIMRIPFAGTFNKTWFALQLEIGSVASMFERLPRALNLSLCQRYCYVLQPADIRLAGYTTAATAVGYSTRFPVTMRATPSATDTLTYVYAGTVSGAGTTFLSQNSYTTNASAGGQYIVTASAGTVVFSAEY